MAWTSPSSSSEAPAGWAAFEAAASARLLETAPGAALGLLNVHFRQRLPLAAAYGQPVADAAFAEAEARMVGALRPGDHLLRSGHGDYYLLLPRLLGLGHAELAAQRLVRELENVIDIDGRHLHLLPTIGVALASHPNEAVRSLQRRASSALLKALRGGHTIGVARAHAEEAMLSGLRDALSRNALDLVYQPIVTLPERGIVGYEALARWRRGDGESIAPSVFIPLAEDAGLAADLTRWTLQVALREFMPMHRRHPSRYCAINLSARAFDNPALADQILGALDIWGLPPTSLMVEVTETAVLRDVGRHPHALRRLAECGVRLAIDDFGQGYSSLAYLQHLPAAIIKIDQGFVADSANPRARALVDAISQLAHRLDMRAVAEGVESEDMLGAALEAGCDFAQGYLFGRPAPMAQWLLD